MHDRSLLAYVVARRNAAEMDRRGVPPNLLIRIVNGLVMLAGGGMVLVGGVLVLIVLAAALHII